MIDIQDVYYPKIVKEISFDNALKIPSSLSYVIDEDLLVVGLWTGGIAFIDVADPPNAETVKEYSSPEGRFICASQDVKYLWSADALIAEIWDITDWQNSISKVGETAELEYPINKIMYLPGNDRYVDVAAGKAG